MRNDWYTHFSQQPHNKADVTGNILLFFYKKKRKQNKTKKIIKYYQPRQPVVGLLWEMSVWIISPTPLCLGVMSLLCSVSVLIISQLWIITSGTPPKFYLTRVKDFILKIRGLFLANIVLKVLCLISMIEELILVYKWLGSFATLKQLGLDLIISIKVTPLEQLRKLLAYRNGWPDYSSSVSFHFNTNHEWFWFEREMIEVYYK
jgi:hypothetical protein